MILDAAKLVLKGWLATHPDGYECRLAPDQTRANIYAQTHHALIEPMFVLREGDADGTKTRPVIAVGYPAGSGRIDR